MKLKIHFQLIWLTLWYHGEVWREAVCYFTKGDSVPQRLTQCKSFRREHESLPVFSLCIVVPVFWEWISFAHTAWWLPLSLAWVGSLTVGYIYTWTQWINNSLLPPAPISNSKSSLKQRSSVVLFVILVVNWWCSCDGLQHQKWVLWTWRYCWH